MPRLILFSPLFDQMISKIGWKKITGRRKLIKGRLKKPDGGPGCSNGNNGSSKSKLAKILRRRTCIFPEEFGEIGIVLEIVRSYRKLLLFTKMALGNMAWT